jgi:hypothetical protein
MARLPRRIDIEPIYHTLNRGNHRADVVSEEGDRGALLERKPNGPLL